ncbi:hypothetical protein J7K44_00280 [bacterium]|nr:hypothetical protein [bacterium]
MKIKVFYNHSQNYYENREKIKEIIEKNLINSKYDVLLVETPIKKKEHWIDIFTSDPDIAWNIKEKLEREGIKLMILIADDFLGKLSSNLFSFSTISRPGKVKKILEKE